MKKDEGELKKSLMCFVILHFFPSYCVAWDSEGKILLFFVCCTRGFIACLSLCVALVTTEADMKLKIRLIKNKT